MDYMDYVDDVAMFMYTGGQATRMNGALNGWRKKLLDRKSTRLNSSH